MARNVTYVVVLNWNGWVDTLSCLDSLFASDTCDLRVIVCDNGSTDDSLAQIEAWARGEHDGALYVHPRLTALLGRSARPLPVTRLHRDAIGTDSPRVETPLVLLDNGANLGFAAGNNTGIRLALAQPDMDSLWLLNNDTLVEPGCLSAMRRCLAQGDDRVLVGSVIHFQDCPEVVQAIGGNRFNRLTGVARQSEGRYLHESLLPDVADIEPRLDYLSGCSMLLPRAFLEEVGLMSEDYFLYYEEIDWFTRAAGRFALRVAGDAHLYHREGSAIGSPGFERPASRISDYHMHRSRLLYMRKYARPFLPACYVAGLGDVVKRLLRGRFGNALTVCAALFGRPYRGAI